MVVEQITTANVEYIGSGEGENGRKFFNEIINIFTMIL